MAALKNFSSLARQLIAATRRDVSEAIELIERKAPAIAGQIRSDARRRGPLSFWGRSRNFDEYAEVTIVDAAVIQLISGLADRTLSPVTPHAGLQHTYGYLFSTIETPYGYKRDRWIEDDLEQAFELSSSTLGPFPEEGTLLANATWFAGQIAFRSKPMELHRLDAFLRSAVAPELHSFSVERGRHLRFTERVSTLWRAERRSWTLQTDIVTSPESRRFFVLVYSVVDHKHDSHQLITLFPVNAGVSSELRKLAQTKQRIDVRTRYNAYVPALAGREFKGICRLKEF